MQRISENSAEFVRWREIAADGAARCRGIVVENRSTRLESDWTHGLAVWDPLTSTTRPDSFDVVLIDGLTREMRSSDGSPVLHTDGRRVPSRAERLLMAVTTAIADGKLILVRTPTSLASLNRLNATTRNIREVDINAFLAGDELIYTLQCHCELIDTTVREAMALYLTPIERSLAAVLDAAEIRYVPQVRINQFVADFVIHGRLVVECDGARFHDKAKDDVRDAAMREAGYEIVRLQGFTIRTNPQLCIDQIRRSLEKVAQSRRDAITRIENSRDNPPSSDQESVIRHVLGPARVLAPAGSGKTTVVANRVARMVAEGVEPERVCSVSFTNVAVREMSARYATIAARADLPSLRNVVARTLNSLGQAICEGHETIGKRAIVNVAGRPGMTTRLDVLRRALSSVASQRSADSAAFREILFKEDREILDTISFFRQTLQLPDFSDDKVTFGEEDLAAREARFIDVHDAYVEHMQKLRVTDFDGQILDAVKVLMADPAYRVEWSKKFDHWIVDEFQDLSMPKIMLLRLLAAPARNMMVVGDDDQIIFGFAGARNDVFESMGATWNDMATYVLETNYRSAHEIVVRSGWLISRNRERVPKNIRPAAPLRDVDEVIFDVERDYWEVATSIISTELEIAGASIGDPPESSVAYGRVGFLFRTRAEGAVVEKLLSDSKIPHNKIVKRSFFRHRTVKSLWSWLRIVNSCPKPEDWMNALQLPTRYLTRNALVGIRDTADPEDLIKRIISGDTTIPQHWIGKSTSGMIMDQLKTFLTAVVTARRHASPVEQLRSLGFENVLGTPHWENNVTTGPINGAMSDEAVDDVIAYRAFEDLMTVCRSFVEADQWRARSESDVDVKWDQPGNYEFTDEKVVLSTVHGFKGRQRPIIGVLGRPTSMPHGRAEGSEEFEEERRVAYVAATRAQERLVFTSSTQYQLELTSSESGLTWDQYLSSRTESDRP